MGKISLIVGLVLVQSRRRYTVAKEYHTNCDICGGSLLHPDEIKEGVHKRCFEEWKKKNY
tara:strand:+ start:539 stop:718 length:180 start_codon:yes stop_codon:yes gene_type:complete